MMNIDAKLLTESNLTNSILFAPSMQEADKIGILSGYPTPNMASWYLKALEEKQVSLKVNLLVGMIPSDGLSTDIHEGFCKLHRALPPEIHSTFECEYVTRLPSFHGNIYVFLKEDRPLCAFGGSAPFNQSSFVYPSRQEIMFQYDARTAWDEFQKIEATSIYCTHSEIEEYVRITKESSVFDSINKTPLEKDSGLERVVLSLLSSKGKIGAKSGLNWGHREGRNQNQAYIPIPKKVSVSGFFPNDGRHITVHTDDNKVLVMRTEQQRNKALTTPLSNAELGEYFRYRLGLGNGDFVREEDLAKYGRTDVEFIKYDDETYFMNFASR